MNRRELEQVIKDEAAEWPGISVEFDNGGKHPQAKFTFTPDEGPPMILRRAFGGNQEHVAFPHKMLADMRKVMAQLGATRAAPEPKKEETERRYHKPNDGAEKRPHPVAGEPAAVKPTIADQLVQQGAMSESVAAYMAQTDRVADAGEGEDEDREAALAAMQKVIDSIEDGIYFDLPDHIYHAVPRLSSSGIQKLCVSPATFWRGSWLDPDRPELDEEQTAAQLLGKAYHVARLEPERFHATYVREIDKADYPAKGFLSSDEKVKAELKALGQQQTVSGESTAERAERLVDAGYEGTIFPLEKARWQETVKGRISLAAKHFDQIVTDMERIRGSGEIAELLSDGVAEVSIFYTDRHGIKMKSRVDWLKAAMWADLKTFDNTRGIELAQALVNAVRYNRLYVQAVVYRDALEAIRTGGLQIRGEATDAQRAIIAAIQIRPDPLACWFIFQEKGGIPNLLGREFRFGTAGAYRDQEIDVMVDDEDDRERVRGMHASPTMLCNRGVWEVERAKKAFALYCEVYPPGHPWFPIEPLAAFDDLDFNTYWLEGRQGS